MQSVAYDHASYEEWNIELWLINDLELFSLARECRSARDLMYALHDQGYVETFDGERITPELAAYAWEWVRR